MSMFDDEEPEGFTHVIEDAKFAFSVIGIVSVLSLLIHMIFWG